MNFLAHLHLGDRSDDLLVGSFLGDFCKGSVDKFPERWRSGIRLHRRVDAFTDDHALPKRSAGLLRETVGRYAPVVVDVVYDHLLAMNWDAFSNEPFDEAVERYYALLRDRRDEFPEIAAWVADRMASHDWLRSYRDLAGVRTALERMSNRLRNGVRLDGSLTAIESRYDVLRDDFLPFYREIGGRVGEWVGED